MAVPLGTLALLLIVASGSAYTLLDNDGEDPTTGIIWPSSYNFDAEELDVENNRVKTYEAWYSSEYNKSRIDYFGGVYRQYYYGETDDDTGYMFTINSVASKELEVEEVCKRKNAKGSQQDFLSKAENFKREGEEIMNNMKVQKWTSEKMHEGKSVHSIYYVHRSESGYDVPVKHITRIHDNEQGNLIYFVIVNYHRFSTSVQDADVSYDKEPSCADYGVFGRDFKTDIDYLNPSIPGHLDVAFHGYKLHHNKVYSQREHEVRKTIFHKNWKLVEDHNRKNLGFKLETNEFADWTNEEYGMLTGTKPSDKEAEGPIPFPHEELMATVEDLPESYDMRLDGFLRPVSYQGNCGSCWAYSTTAAVEAVLSRNNGQRNLDLSEQSLVDCAWGYENGGCEGGQLDRALTYVLDHQIPTESEYGPYLEQEGICHIENMTQTFGIRGFSKVTTNDPEAMKAALFKYGPVAVALYASDYMKLYSSGIFYDITCEGTTAVNHGVVVVGYGVRDGVGYWIVRNSWGERWGEAGYILISTINNNCNILSTPYYPVV